MLNAINERLNLETAKYPIRRVDVKTFTIPTGTQSKICDHLFQGQMPKRIILRTANKNPFNVKNAIVKKLEVSIDGETTRTRPFEPDFDWKNLVLIGLPTSLSRNTKRVTSYGIVHQRSRSTARQISSD